MFTGLPVHGGLSGGADAKVSPATSHTMGHADTLIVKGDNPESKTGDGSFPPSGVPAWNVSVEGSIAYCQAAVGSNSRSTASGCWVFRARTVWLRGMS